MLASQRLFLAAGKESLVHQGRVDSKVTQLVLAVMVRVLQLLFAIFYIQMFGIKR